MIFGVSTMIKQKLIQLLIIFMVIAIFIPGCKNSIQEPKISMDSPYNWVGIEHNKCLSYVIGKVTNDSLKDWQDYDVEKLVIDYFNSTRNMNVQQNVKIVGSKTDLNKKYVDSYFQFVDSLVTIGSVSATFRNFDREIINAIGEYDFEESLEDIEAEVARSKINQYEKEILFIEISVARHSSKFWSNETRISKGKRPMLGLGPIAVLVGIDVIGGGISAYFSWHSGHSGWDIAKDALVGAAGTSACAWLGARL